MVAVMIQKIPMRVRVTLFLLSALAGCTETSPIQSFAGHAQGTTYHISFWSEDGIDLPEMKRSVIEELKQIDAKMSDYRSDSLIERFNREGGTAPYDAGTDIVALVEQARLVNRASQGCYDLTIKPLFDLWGFTDDRFTPPQPQSLRQTIASVGMDKLEAHGGRFLRKKVPALKVDLSSIAQGYSVARIAGILERYGIDDYLVEIGGELQTRGSKPDRQPWRIAIEKPLPGAQRVEKIITINRTEPVAVMTSGTYRHFFDEQGIRYSHILDARTGRPVEHSTVSVTVLYPDPAAADAWSTALLCLGQEQGLKAADANGIPALFIEHHAKGLREYFSRPLIGLRGVHIE